MDIYKLWTNLLLTFMLLQYLECLAWCGKGGGGYFIKILVAGSAHEQKLDPIVSTFLWKWGVKKIKIHEKGGQLDRKSGENWYKMLKIC